MSSENNQSGLTQFGDRLFQGTLWMIAMRWSVRLLGVVSITILARLLDKTDFGLVAMATAVVALPQILLDMGVEQAVIREKTPNADIYNTAWTIRLAQMLFVAVVVFVSAPWVADFYGDGRIVEILQVLSLAVLIRGAENIWVVSFLKSYSFRRDFAYNTSLKVISVVLTVSLALWFRSYWALVYAQLILACVRLVLSFSVAPGRARLTVSQWRRIWSFSQWSLAKGLAQYVLTSGDRMLLGKLAGADLVGLYTVSREIADTPTSEISAPINRVLGPGFSSMQNEPMRLAAAITKSVGAVVTVALPIAVGLALTAPFLVPVALGPGWDGVAPLLQILAIAAIFSSTRGILGNALAVIGYIRTATFVAWFRAIVVVSLGIPATIAYGPEGLAGTYLLAEFASLFVKLYFFRRYVPQLSFYALLHSTVRAIISVSAMAVVVVATSYAGLSEPGLMLLAQVVVGAFTYATTLVVLWVAMGRPDSVERIVLEHLSALRGGAGRASR